MPVKRQHPDGTAAPKRTRFTADTADPSARSSYPGSSNSSRPGSSSSKSRQEADDEEQDLLTADLPEGAQRDKQRGKRQLTGARGYDSDSSNDDEGVVYSRRKDKGKAGVDEEEDDDMDMFGGGSDDEESKDKGKGRGTEKDKGTGKGDKEFLDLKDIEGQEFSDDRRRGGVYSDDEDDLPGGSRRGSGRKSKQDENEMDVEGADVNEENEEDYADEEAKRAAHRIAQLDGDMGYELTGFNMKDEMEEGRFTADGETYVANAKDEGDKHDQWLTEVDDDAILKARRAHKEREKREAELERAETDGVASEEARKKEEGLMREAAALMERGETVLEALQRLGAEVERKRKEEAKKKSWAERQKERKAEQDGRYVLIHCSRLSIAREDSWWSALDSLKA